MFLYKVWRRSSAGLWRQQVSYSWWQTSCQCNFGVQIQKAGRHKDLCCPCSSYWTWIHNSRWKSEWNRKVTGIPGLRFQLKPSTSSVRETPVGRGLNPAVVILRSERKAPGPSYSPDPTGAFSLGEQMRWKMIKENASLNMKFTFKLVTCSGSERQLGNATDWRKSGFLPP